MVQMKLHHTHGSMLEDIFDHIDKELGPLNPDWFEELKAQACGDDGEPDQSKVEEEINIRATQKSPLFSTPKIFKQHFLSPGYIRNDDSPCEVTNDLDSSPCLFGSEKEKFDGSCLQPRECFGILDTPKRPLAHSATKISHSLGAQINPDVSWTSSFNTPSSLTPTVILPKTEARPSSAYSFKDKEAIFVRKLFPSLSKGPESTPTFSETDAKQEETVQTDGLVNTVSLAAGSLWKKKVASAIEDGDVRNTVQSILDGADDVLSIFFSSNSCALRKVKSQERSTKKSNCSNDGYSTVEPGKEQEETINGVEIQTADVETKSPLKNSDVMQWTPLSLSDSSLNQGPSQGLPLINSHSSVVSSEPNPGTFYCSAAGGSQERHKYSEAHTEMPQQRRSLLDKSPTFMLSTKPRKFVYQVPGSDILNTGITHKALLCSEKTVTENRSEKIVSAVLNESSFVSDDAKNSQTLQQLPAKYMDEGLDMTQLSKAFAEDFTQELTTGELVDTHVQSEQSYMISSAGTTPAEKPRQVKPDRKIEKTKECFINLDQGDCNDNCTMADVSVDSANESTAVLPTFEISRDSGCPNTFSELDGTTTCKDSFTGFKTTSNRTIAVTHESVMRAKLSLHEAVGDSLIDTFCNVTSQLNNKIETLSEAVSESALATTSPLGQSNCPSLVLKTCVSDAQASPGLINSMSFKQNISSCSSPQSFILDTCSKRNISNSDVVFQESGTSQESLEKDTELSKRQTVNTSQDNAGENVPLTASQKADVTELCNLLEEADSQCEFTQLKPKKFASDSHIEKEWDTYMLNGVDFDDSFNTDGVNGKNQIKSNASTINNSINTKKEQECASVQILDVDICDTSKEDQKESFAKPEHNCVIGMNHYFSGNSFGFKTATGKVNSISETNKANHFSDEHDEKALNERKDKKEYTDVIRQEVMSSSNISDCMEKEYMAHLQLNQDANETPKDTEQSCLDGKTDVVCLNLSSHFGFSTAQGKQLKVSQTALEKARKLLNDIDSIQVSEPQELIFHTSGRHAGSTSTTALQKTKAVTWRETSININHSHSEKIDQMANVMDIPSFKCKNFIQEQKSGSDAREQFRNICPPETCQLLSVHGYGFQTASGKGVSVSAEALEKSKIIFNECDDNIDCLDASVIKENNHKLDVEILQQTNEFTNPSGTGSKDFENIFSKGDSESIPINNNCGFTTASGKEVSVSAESLQKAKDVFKDSVGVFLCTNDSRLAKQFVDTATCTSFSENPNGFSTASGKKVTISATALQKAKSIFSVCEEERLSSEDILQQSCGGTVNVKAHVDTIHSDLQSAQDGSISDKASSESGGSIGFCTAGGKKVEVSATALQRAKSLFQDCENEGLTSNALQNQCLKGFHTANEKLSTVSEKALHEVSAAGFSDPSFSHETMSSSNEQKGFFTAGGKKVAISASALQRAKSLFEDCDEKLLHETGSSHARNKDVGNESPKFDQNFGFSTASGKGVSFSKVALKEATKLCRDFTAQHDNDTNNLPLENRFSKPSYPQVDYSKLHRGLPITQNRLKDDERKCISHPTNGVQNEHAQLDLHSLDLSSCTETQQEYFEQEAMACTKALLADEDLNKLMLVPSAKPSVDDLHTQGSVEQNKRKRQHDASSIKDSCQPPLKRQLLSEFEKTDCAEPSATTTVKNFPNGILKARRVFRYSDRLHPNPTNSNQTSVDETSNDYLQISSNTAAPKRKPSVFVPPFKKIKKPEMADGQDTSKAPIDFIPPFKKETKDNTHQSSNLIKNPCESKPHADFCSVQENTVTNSIPSTNNCEQYSGENNQHETSEPEETILVSNIALKHLASEERGIVDTEAWSEILQLARDMQDIRLQKKKRQNIRPVPGQIFCAKTSGVARISLRDAVRRKCPVRYSPEELNFHGVYSKLSHISSENAESFRFDCTQFFNCELLMVSGAVQFADGGWLVPDSNGTVGKEEFCRALYDTPGVDPKLICDAWVFNHYRWIVWKRASMERAFPDLMGSLCLTPEQVLLQLKFRYDVEVDHSKRSCLRRIMERDDTAAKTLVLCVCGVAKLHNTENVVKTDARSPDAQKESTVTWLTDGWYAIKGLLDLPLTSMLNNGRIRIGDKVVINGAELVGSQEACPPLEAPESLMLKISANSTRRARWDTKLGYYRDPRPFRVPLSSLFSAGGVVSSVDILVLRSYPTQWMEKKPNGVFIFRNDRAEDREARIHSNSKHKTMELLLSNIEAQFEKEMEAKKTSSGRKRTYSRHEIEALQDGEDLYEAMECDPAVESHLSERQMEAVSKFRCYLGERKQAELQERLRKSVKEAQEAQGGCPDRDVTPVWKLNVVDATDVQSNCVYTLNIWRPSAELYSLLKEGRRYRAYHLATSESKKRVGIAHVQLTATKKTVFRDIEVTPEWLRLHFNARFCVCFRELQNPQFSSPCGEVDVVGYIVSIVDKQGNSPVLHLIDEKFDLVSVRTSGSLEQLAIEELVKPHALVAFSNLQLRQLSGPVPSLYAGEQALFSINPKESHLQEAMVHLKSFVQTCEGFFSIAEEKMSNTVPSGVSGSFQSPRTPGVSNPKTNGLMTPQHKGRVFSAFTPVSTPVSTSKPDAKDPKSVKRKRGLVYLSRIPSPPPLTPLKTKASPCVNNTFNPPRSSLTPKPLKKDSPRATGHSPGVEEWVPDEEMAMIDTQALLDGLN